MESFMNCINASPLHTNTNGRLGCNDMMSNYFHAFHHNLSMHTKM